MKKLIPLLLLPLLSGCSYISHEGNGTKTTIIVPAFGSRIVNAADLQKGVFNGVSSEQTQMGEAIGIGVAAGMKALKP